MKKAITILCLMLILSGFGEANKIVLDYNDDIQKYYYADKLEIKVNGETLVLYKNIGGVLFCDYYEGHKRISMLCEANKFELADKFDLTQYNGIWVYAKNISSLKDKYSNIPLKYFYHDNDLSIYTLKINASGNITKYVIPVNCYGVKKIDNSLFFYMKQNCVPELNNALNDIIYFESNSYIINYTGGNNTLQNATFTQSRFWRDCYDIGLSHPDYEDNSIKGEWSFRCNNSRDNSQNNNDGTIYGATWNATAGHNTYDAGSFNFDGVDDYIDVTGLTSTSTTQTVEFWVNSRDKGVGRDLFDAETGRLVLRWALSGTNIALYDGVSFKSFGLTPSSNVWHHIVFVLDGSTSNATVYVNGVQSGSTLSYTPRQLGGTIHIGSNFGGVNVFNGTIDEVRIYNRVLSVTEILAHYNDGLPYYAKGNATYYNISLNGSLINVTINKTRNGTVNIYVQDTLECNLTGVNEYCNISGSYNGSVNLTLEFINYSTPNVNEIVLNDGGAINVTICYCINCSDCTAKLNNVNCINVNLTVNINNYSESNCILINNLASKTFNCLNNLINGTNILQNGIYINNSINISVLNCNISNFQNGIKIQNSTINEVENNVVCDNWEWDIINWDSVSFGALNTATLLYNFMDEGYVNETTYQCYPTTPLISDSSTIAIYISLMFIFIILGALFNNRMFYLMFGFGLFMLSLQMRNIVNLDFLWLICLFSSIYYIFKVITVKNEN